MSTRAPNDGGDGAGHGYLAPIAASKIMRGNWPATSMYELAEASRTLKRAS